MFNHALTILVFEDVFHTENSGLLFLKEVKVKLKSYRRLLSSFQSVFPSNLAPKTVVVFLNLITFQHHFYHRSRSYAHNIIFNFQCRIVFFVLLKTILQLSLFDS